MAGQQIVTARAARLPGCHDRQGQQRRQIRQELEKRYQDLKTDAI